MTGVSIFQKLFHLAVTHDFISRETGFAWQDFRNDFNLLYRKGALFSVSKVC